MRVFGEDELRRRVDEVLFYVWDPVGVEHEPCARAEYESYVPQVLELVEKSDETEPISLYLQDIEKTHMGLSTANKKRCDEVAELLIDHKWAIKEGHA